MDVNSDLTQAVKLPEKKETAKKRQGASKIMYYQK
jgi:hypothetical protein